MKLIFLAIVIFGIYFIFFKKPNVLKNSKDYEDSETVIECEECGLYVSAKEMVMRDGKQYCSKECARLK